MENTRIYWRLIWRRLEDLFDKVDHQNVQKMIKIFNRDFSENQTQKILTLDITNLEESQKAKLRDAIRFFHGDRNNMNVQIKVNDEFKPCGQIYLTPEILQFFKSIVGEENCKI